MRFASHSLRAILTRVCAARIGFLTCCWSVRRPPATRPFPGGVLDLDTAWRFCLEHAVGLPDARADVAALLAWTAGEGNLDRFHALPQASRDKILERLGSEGGGAALLVTSALSAGYGSDALSIGLVCGVVFVFHRSKRRSA